MIVGAGDGVLYSRGDNGALYRSSYDHKTQSWTEKSKKVGLGGWGIYKSVTSAGGDTLYGVRDNGELVWYRYLNSAGHWHKADSGVVIGLGGWTQFYDVVADPSACRLTG